MDFNFTLHDDYTKFDDKTLGDYDLYIHSLVNKVEEASNRNPNSEFEKNFLKRVDDRAADVRKYVIQRKLYGRVASTQRRSVRGTSKRSVRGTSKKKRSSSRRIVGTSKKKRAVHKNRK